MPRLPKPQLHQFITCLTERFDEVAGQLHRLTITLDEKTLTHPIVSGTVNNLMLARVAA